MRKTTFLFVMLALFGAAGAYAQTLETVWRRGATAPVDGANYSWNTGDRCRDAAVHNGRIYVASNSGATVFVIDGATGNELPAITGVTNNSFGIAFDDAGNLLVPNNGGGGTTWALRNVNVTNGTSAAIPGWTGANVVRIDFFDARGDINSTTEPAYLIGHGNSTQTLLAFEFLNGQRTATPAFSFNRTLSNGGTNGGTGADAHWMDDSRVLLTGQGRIPQIWTIDFAANPFVTNQANLGFTATAHDAGGGAYFELGGIPYVVLPPTRMGAVNLYDISNPATPVRIGANPTVAALGTTTNGSIHIGVQVEKVSEEIVMVYIWAPNNGAAAYSATAANAQFSQAGGTFIDTNNLALTLSSTSAGATITYSLNGGAFEVYTGAINLGAGTTTVTMRVEAAGLFPHIKSETYTLVPPQVVDQFTVTFDSQGGSAVADAIVVDGEKVAKPADPTKDGYTFEGWYKEDTFLNAWNFDVDVVTADITLFAKWAEVVIPPTPIVNWNFRGIIASDNFGASPFAPETADANLTVVGLTRGWTLVTGTAAAAGWGGNNFSQAANSFATAVAANQTVRFTLTANAGYELSITSIGAYNVRRSNAGPATGQWQYSLDGTNFTDIGTEITWGTITTAAGNPQAAIDLSGITALQSVAAGTTVTFRLVLWGSGTGTAGTFYFNDGAGSGTPGLPIFGTLEEVIVPPIPPVNYPDLAPDATALDKYYFEQIGTTVNVSSFPTNISRMLQRDGKLYVLHNVPTGLAANTTQMPIIGIYNAETLELIRNMETPTSVITGAGARRLINDIAFTADGKLLACNRAVITSTGSAVGAGLVNDQGFRVYIWDNDDAQPRLFYQLNRMGLANSATQANPSEAQYNTMTEAQRIALLNNYGNGWYVNAILGETMAVSGPSWDAIVYMPVFSINSDGTMPAANQWRMVAHVVKDGQLVRTSYKRRQTTGAATETEFNQTTTGSNFGGLGFQITISPRGENNIIITRNDANLAERTLPAEFSWDWSESSRISALQSGMTFVGAYSEAGGYVLNRTNGINYFRYAGMTYMVAPIADVTRANAGVALFDITNGLNNAKKVSSKYPEAGLGATEAPFMMAYGTVSVEDIVLGIFAQNQGYARFIMTDAPIEPVEFTVSFDSQGGTAINDVLVLEGGLVPRPTDPTKDGYVFKGWFRNSIAWNFDTDVVAEDMTLVAAWELVPVPIVGDYFIPATGDQRGWANFGEAFAEINQRGISGDVNLLITSDFTQATNVGLINNTDFSITVKPAVEGDRPVITFTGTNGINVSGITLGLTAALTWETAGIAKNITFENLELVSTATVTVFTIYQSAENITIRNCRILQNNNANNTHGVYLRAHNTSTVIPRVLPRNVTIEDCFIQVVNQGTTYAVRIDDHLLWSSPGHAVGTIIRNNTLIAGQRVLHINYANGAEISGNTFHSRNNTNLQGGGITSDAGSSGTIRVFNNKFVELRTSNTTSGMGKRHIGVMSTGATWIIENNYFTGFARTSATGSTYLHAILVSSNVPVIIRHNTFYLNKLANNSGFSANPTGNLDPAYAAIAINATRTPVIENNLFVSDEDVAPNFFVRGDIPPVFANNVFSIANATATKIASGTGVTGTEQMVTREDIVFEDAANGDLSLAPAAEPVAQLLVPVMAEVPTDIAGATRNNPTYAGAFEFVSTGPTFKYSFEQVGTTLNTDGLPANIKRTVYHDGKLFVLHGVPTGPAASTDLATISVFDAVTLAPLFDMNTDGIAAQSGTVRRLISDIGITADGKLIACNMALLNLGGTLIDANAVFRTFIWDNLNATTAPRVFYEIPANAANAWFFGQWFNNRLGETMSVNGPSTDVLIILPSWNGSTDAYTDVRLVGHRVTNGVPAAKNRMRSGCDNIGNGGANFTLTNTTWLAQNMQFSASSRGFDYFIVTSDGKAPAEVDFRWDFRPDLMRHDVGAMVDFTGGTEFDIAGANMFSFDGSQYLVAPALQAGRVNASVVMFDVTEGFDKPEQVSAQLPETVVKITRLGTNPAASTMAYGSVSGNIMTLGLLAQNQGYAQFQTTLNVVVPVFFTVSFDSQGGSAVPAVQVEEGKFVPRPVDPTKDGYTFDGWFKDGVEWNFATDAVTEDITLLAMWTKVSGPVYFTVTFDSQGGSPVDPVQVLEGNLVTKPADPTRDGYTFDGWFRNGVEWDFANNVVTEDITLLGMWTKIPVPVYFTVTFDSRGGSAVNPNPVQVLEGDKVARPADPTKDGFDFAGWFKGDEELRVVHSATGLNMRSIAGNTSAETLVGNIPDGSNFVVNTSSYVMVGTVMWRQTTYNGISAWVSLLASLSSAVSEYATEWDFDNDVVTENTTLIAKWDAKVNVPTIDLNSMVDVRAIRNGNILVNVSGTTFESYSIFGIDGRLLRSERAESNSIEIDGTNLNAGALLIQVNTAAGTVTKRIMR